MKSKYSSRFWIYALGVGLVIITTGVGELIKLAAIVDPTNMDIIYVLCVTISAVYLGIWVSLMVTLLSVLAFDFLFLPPLYTFAVANSQEAINLLILLVVCFIISLLSNQIILRK